MLKLSEYRTNHDRLTDHLPWVALVAPGIVLTKDGGFQRSFAFRGPDLESAPDSALVNLCARANNALRRLGSGWAVFFEARRVEAAHYPASSFPDCASQLVDDERRLAFEAGEHFENHAIMTLFFLASPDAQNRTEQALLDTGRKEKTRDWQRELTKFREETDRLLDLFAGFLPEITPLDDAQTLTFLHDAISTHRHPIAVPDVPMYLDGVLADTPFTGGLEPRLGACHLRTHTILGFPNTTQPALLDALNHQNFAYRWVTRFMPLDKAEAAKVLTRIRRQWFAKRKSISALLREIVTNEPVPLVDNDADNKATDADAALQALGGDHVGFGYLTVTVTVWDDDRQQAEEKARAVERILGNLGFACIRESVNAVEAWLGSLPGHVYANVRQPLVHTLNLAHLMPLSAEWAGPVRNAHLGGPPLFYAETPGSTPFRFSTHVGDVGHMLIVGPTGAGKSVLLSLMALQFRRYQNAQVIIFDKGRSARAAVLAMGGVHHTLGAGDALAFQPLRDIDDPATRSWASEWIGTILQHEKLLLTPEVKESVWSALNNLAGAPQEERTLTGLSVLVQDRAVKAALKPYTLDGPFGRLLDAAEDRLAFSQVQCFEMEELMHERGVVLPVLTYLFRRLEERFDGRPSLLILDEAWVYLDEPMFASRIREWLKVLRKRNVSVVFATQSLADIARSTIAPALIESCPQRLFLPNDRALEPQTRAIYAQFGLNERQIELIARATPKQHYVLQSRCGNRLFDLGLGPIALALCGASDSAAQRLIDGILAEQGSEDFLTAFLKRRGLEEMAAHIQASANAKEG